jgi:hypothetical protein
MRREAGESLETRRPPASPPTTAPTGPPSEPTTAPMTRPAVSATTSPVSEASSALAKYLPPGRMVDEGVPGAADASAPRKVLAMIAMMVLPIFLSPALPEPTGRRHHSPLHVTCPGRERALARLVAGICLINARIGCVGPIRLGPSRCLSAGRLVGSTNNSIRAKDLSLSPMQFSVRRRRPQQGTAAAFDSPVPPPRDPYDEDTPPPEIGFRPPACAPVPPQPSACGPCRGRGRMTVLFPGAGPRQTLECLVCHGAGRTYVRQR